MPFVKLDKEILTSSLWVNSDVALIFITALLLAEPYELTHPAPQLAVDDLIETGFVVPPGWYGFVPAAGVGIIGQAMLPMEQGKNALRTLGEPDSQSRSQEHAGRRLVRINGGYIVLNYIRYREKDHTAAERMRRYRMRKNGRESKPENTQAAFEAEILKFWRAQNPDHQQYALGARDRRALEMLLKQHQALSLEEFKKLLRNRAASQINPSAAPYKWLPSLMEYSAGPLNQYGKPLK